MVSPFLNRVTSPKRFINTGVYSILLVKKHILKLIIRTNLAPMAPHLSWSEPHLKLVFTFTMLTPEYLNHLSPHFP